MATESYRYDHPAYTARYATAIHIPATAASTPAAKFVAFTACKVKSIRGNVTVTGTNDAAGYDILNGTTSVADCTVGTNAAGSAVSVTLTDQTLAAGGYIEFKTKANSATMVNDFIVEYELVPGASVTS